MKGWAFSNEMAKQRELTVVGLCAALCANSDDFAALLNSITFPSPSPSQQGKTE